MGLPDGYDTKIGEGSCRLSGGQRQRIAIARAFLKDAPILIFDEPTSAIDIHTEQEIMQATEQLVRGRTTFVIAHRLSTIENCDLQLVLKDGKLMTLTNDFQNATAVMAGQRTAGGSGYALNPLAVWQFCPLGLSPTRFYQRLFGPDTQLNVPYDGRIGGNNYCLGSLFSLVFNRNGEGSGGKIAENVSAIFRGYRLHGKFFQVHDCPRQWNCLQCKSCHTP